MDWAIIRENLQRTPFVPFRVEKTGGIWFDVTNPAMAVVTRRALELAFPLEGGGQRFVTFSLIHVVSLDVVLPTPS